MARNKRWIQQAIKKRGALTQYLERVNANVFNRDGTISVTKLKEWYEDNKDHLDKKTKHRINLFFTLHKLKRKKRKR
jgi:hypothetical protein